jgi:hypothetical protein
MKSRRSSPKFFMAETLTFRHLLRERLCFASFKGCTAARPKWTWSPTQSEPNPQGVLSSAGIVLWFIQNKRSCVSGWKVMLLHVMPLSVPHVDKENYQGSLHLHVLQGTWNILHLATKIVCYLHIFHSPKMNPGYIRAGR